MKWKLAVLLAAALAATSCRNDKGMRREQKNYDVVQEGSASGVSSTISGPGETPPPATASYPMTETNADTTSAFNLSPTQPVTQQPSTIAGTMPQPTMIRPRPKPVRRDETGTTMATDTVAVQPQTNTTTTEPQPEPTTTDTAPPPPPPTDTTTTTTTTKPPRQPGN